MSNDCQTYDFNTVIDRRNSGAIKYARIPAMCEGTNDPDLIPLWIADMDYPTPHFISEALQHRLQHPILGYTDLPAELWPTVSRWIENLHGWHTQTEWFHFIPGIVKGIGLVINHFVGKDEKVIIQPPVYHPFRLVPEGNNREVVCNPLLENPDGSYSMDFDNLEQITDNKCRLLILCNPHNPGGIIWDRATLVRLAEFCHKHSIIVISDEIHSDMALWGNTHIPFASVSPKAAECSITFGAPSKTFNMAGMVSSYTIIPSAKLREPFFHWLDVNELASPDIFAPIATIAAFTHGAEWRQTMLREIEKNILFTENYCANHIPSIKPLRPQASFLSWLDCRGLGLTQVQLNDLFVKKAKLLLNDGTMFGTEGTGFMRMNLGTPQHVLQTALKRLADAVETI